MPGITGILEVAPPPDQLDRVRRMAARMVHESFHGQSVHADSVCPAHLGWVWDTAFPENHAALRWDEQREIGVLLAGDDFSGRVAALPESYSRLGVASLRDLNGNASGVILDRRDGGVVLFNDRFGLGRVYVYRTSDALYFASEAKSLLAVLPGTRRWEERSLAEAYTVGCVLQNRSLFRDIHLLPPASAWIFHRDGRLEKQRYFDPGEWEKQPALSPAAYADALVETFKTVVPRYVRSGDGSAMSLTGGLDSRMLLAWAHPAPGTLPCYTFAGPFRECADVRIARKLASVARQEHSVIGVGNDFLGRFSQLAERSSYQSDGTMDVSGAVELYCNEKARSISARRLTGNYGSEVLRANVAFRPTAQFESLFEAPFREELRRAAATYAEERQGSRMTFILFKQVPWHHYSRRTLETGKLMPVSPFLDNDLAQLAYQCPEPLCTKADPLLSLISRGDPRLMRIPTDRSLHLSRLGWLGKVAREYREFTAKAEYAFDYGMPKSLVTVDRRLRALRLERLFLGRHKFYHFRTWYRDSLAAQISTLSRSLPTLPSPFVPSAAEKAITEHTNGRGNHTLAIHKLLSSQLILSRLLSET